MENSYCGKKCAECAEREQLGCPGCRQGPGRYITGSCDCPIAECCNENRIRSCADCEKAEGCFQYGRREHISETRLHIMQKQKREQIRQSKRLAPRLLLLCIVLVLQFVLTLLSFHDWGQIIDVSSETFFNYLDTAIQFVLALILLSAGTVSNSHFIRAGIWMLTATVLSLILHAMASPDFIRRVYYRWDTTILIVGVLIALLIEIAGLAAVFYEMYGCADATEFFDAGLAAKWRRLWRWYLGLHLSFIVCFAFSSQHMGIRWRGRWTVDVLAAVLGVGIMIVFYLIRAGCLISTARCLNRLEEDSR